MNKVFNKIIIPIFFICSAFAIGFGGPLVIMAGTAIADKLENGEYILYDTINSGGMTLQGGEYILKDSKGEALGGVMKGGDYSLTPGILGVLVGVTTPEVPPGTVKLYISRDNLDIKITWEASKYGAIPQIFALVGNDGTGLYQNNYDAQKWVPVANNDTVGTTSVTINPGSLKHLNQVGGGAAEIYYKGLLSGINDYAKYIPSAEAVGKVNVAFSVGVIGSNYLSYPFIQGNNSIKEVLDVNSFPEGTKIYSQMTGPNKDQYDFDVAKLVNKSWLNSFNNQSVDDTLKILPEKSYMVQIPLNTKYTMLGKVVIDSDERTTDIMTYKNTYFGNCRAWAYNLGDVNVNTLLKLSNDVKAGDKIYYPNDTEYNFDVSKYSDGKWINSFTNQPSTMLLKLPKGYMYYRDGNGFSWAR